MKILWLTNIPSPYRLKFFSELGKYCELTVLFEKRTSAERDDSWGEFTINNFKAVFLHGKSIATAEAFCPSIVKFMKNEYDHIVVTNYSDPTGMLAVLTLKTKKIPYEIEGDGAFPNNSSFMKSIVKKMLLSGAKICFSTAKLHDEYYKLNGVKEDKIFRYPFSSVHEKEILECCIDMEKKMALRNRLNMREEIVLLAVGQFIPRKGFDVLLKSTNYLDKRYGIYIVGGVPDDEYKKLIPSDKKANIHFVSFKQSSELEKYYEAADIFVHPTREDIWGLVINEAMAKGLPVVTTNKCIAGLEMVEDNVTGQIVECENEKKLAEAIKNCKLGETVSKHVLQTAREYSIEKMVYTHLQIWDTQTKEVAFEN